jgi:hypothetical protein
MTDEELIAAFETGALPAQQFSHTEHVRVAWWYLSHASLPEALERFSTSLRRFAAAKGVAGKYHETVTVMWILLIADRLDAARGLSWPEFAAANPDLLARAPSVLASYYSDEVLFSERARRTFVMPDRVRNAGR